MDEIEDTLKQSPLYDTLPVQERQELAADIFKKYIKTGKPVVTTSANSTASQRKS